MNMASKIGKTEWKAAFGLAGLIDVLQWVLDFFAVGLVINEVLDPIVGVLMLIYFQLRGASILSKPKRFLSLVGAYAGEAVTDSIAPAWIIDVWYIRGDIAQEEAAAQAQKEQQEMNNVLQPLYKGGVRQPMSQPEDMGIGRLRNPNTQPLVVDGMRRPSR